jgi:hypothetical protein
MSADDLRAIVESAVKDSLRFPWRSYLFSSFWTLVAAYLGAYFKRKAEKKADHEEFETIRQQLIKTTHDTEEIKNNLSGKNWLNQQQWAIREKYYLGLLAHLTKLRLSLVDREVRFDQPGSEYDNTIDETDHFKRLRHIGDEAHQAIRDLIGPAAVFLSEETIKQLEQLDRDYWNAAEDSVCTADYTTKARKLVDAAQAAVLAEAKKDLAHWQPPSALS